MLAIVTLPWFAAISIASKGEFLRFAVGRQILHRVSTDMEAHGGFPGYYPVVSTLVFYPWSAFIPAALVGAWVRRKSDPKFGFLDRLGDRAADLARVFPDEVDPLLPACVSGLCASRCRGSWGRSRAEEVNIRRRPLGRLASGASGRDRPGGARCCSLAGAVIVRGTLSPPMLVVGRADRPRSARRHAVAAAGGDRAGRLFLAGDLGDHAAVLRRLAGAAYRAVPHVAD